MMRSLMDFFDLSPEQAREVEGMELTSLGNAMLRKADRAHTKAERQVKNAQSDVYAAMLLARERQAGFARARQQRPSLSKAAAALEYAANLKLTATRWELAEQLVDRERGRLAAARQAQQTAKARQKAANSLLKRATAATARKSI